MLTGESSASRELETRFPDIAGNLRNIRPNGSDWTARCPAHDDDHNSLSLSIANDGKLLLYCHAGCSTKSVLQVLNIDYPALYPKLPITTHPGRRQRIVAIYDYRDERGDLLYQSVRYDPKDFRFRVPKGDGDWTWKLNGLTRVLYRLQELLAADPSEPILIVEGEKDVDHLRAIGFVSTTNAGGAGKWRNEYSESLRGRQVVILPDNDDPGRRHALGVAQALHGIAASIKILDLPTLPPKGDVSDWIEAGGSADALRRLVAETPDWRPDTASEPVAEPSEDRPEIPVTTDEFKTTEAALQALASDTAIFQRGGSLVQVQRLHQDLRGFAPFRGSFRIIDLPAAILRERLTRCARFVSRVHGENGVTTHSARPPIWCIKALLARGEFPGIRPLIGVIEYPVLRPDGTLLDRPGYDSATGQLYEPAGDPPLVPESPTREDALAARDRLLDVVSDFPFQNDSHRSTWLAALLTVFARPAFQGPAPLFLFDANVRGSGKTLLAEIIGLIATGRELPRMTNPRDDEEARKQLTSVVLSGCSLILIDNVAGTLGSAPLDAALTGTAWQDRRLGKNDLVCMPLTQTWLASGNNVVLGADTARRVCHCRLRCLSESPEERAGFRYPDLRAHVRAQRTQLLSAALTILRAFHCAGRPARQLKPWGSFEGWSSLVRQAIVWIGLRDPGESREELRTTSDRELEVLTGLLAGMSEADPLGAGLTTGEILDRIGEGGCPSLREAIFELCDASPLKLPSPRSLGNRLRRARGRIVGGRALESRPGAKGFIRWAVVSVGESSDSGESCSPSSAKSICGSHALQKEADPDQDSPESPKSPQEPSAASNEACSTQSGD